MQLRQFRLEQCFADGQLSQFSLEAHLREMIPWDFPRRGWVYIGIAASWVPGGHRSSLSYLSAVCSRPDRAALAPGFGPGSEGHYGHGQTPGKLELLVSFQVL